MNVAAHRIPPCDGCDVAGIGEIQYKPDAPASDILCFKYYNPQEVVRGRTMEEWLRFSVCFWHTFRGTGETLRFLSVC